MKHMHDSLDGKYLVCHFGYLFCLFAECRRCRKHPAGVCHTHFRNAYRHSSYSEWVSARSEWLRHQQPHQPLPTTPPQQPHPQRCQRTFNLFSDHQNKPESWCKPRPWKWVFPQHIRRWAWHFKLSFTFFCKYVSLFLLNKSHRSEYGIYC